MTSTTARDAGPRRAVAGQSDVNTLAPFRSVLFPGGAPEPTVGEPAGQPEYFGDLNLDQVEDALTRGRDQYELEPFFRQPLTDIAIMRYRQDVFRDLDRDEVRSQLTGFAEHMASVCKIRTYAAKLRDRQPSRRWLLNAVDEYCRAVVDLQQGLRDVEPRSAGLVGLANYLGDHVAGQAFRALRRESRDLLDQFERLRFALLIRGGKLTVARYDGEPDYCAQVLATFERFRQGDVKDHRARLGSDPFMSHVEVAILDLVAQLFPELFAQLGEFCASHADFVDPTVARADRELQFYLGYHAYTAPLRRAGLRFSYPEVSTTAKRVAAEDTFDIALADKLVTEQAEVITNDFRLDGDERILVVSGPNQGGKTT
ncbi:MAG TPA: hypothetical protein VFU35_01660, partial [Jatrophihabitans sp.]|nr:hypothetical protein [Jatrophihabitans sp.]